MRAIILIVYKGETIGNFRFVWDENLPGLSEEKQVKLHRIYLHPTRPKQRFGKATIVNMVGRASR